MGYTFTTIKRFWASHVYVKTHWYRGLTEDLLDATSDCEQRSVGNGQFAYRFGRAVDGQLHSIWLFEFHGRHWAGGQTAPVDLEEGPVESNSG